MKELKVGIIGFGTVGAGVAENLLLNGDVILKRTGVKVTLAKIADLDILSDRGIEIPDGVLTTSVDELIDNVDLVVELVGGTTIAKKFILQALNAKKAVVTANKALLALHGEELFSAAKENNVDLCFEASVAGGIPIIKGLREGLVSNRIKSIYGIMNGTCNYILTRMEREGVGFEEVLADAQKLGYAEAEPSLDVDGFDTAHKCAVLGSLAYGKWFGMDPVYVEGIRKITTADIACANEFGYRIKLLAVIKESNNKVELRVNPTLVSKDTLLANISDVFNGVLVDGDTVGQTLFYGRGAGRKATASAVVADIADVALNVAYGAERRVQFREDALCDGTVDMSQVECRYMLRCKDKYEVALSELLTAKGVVIAKQGTMSSGEIVFETALCKEENMNAVVEEAKAMAVRVLRIEDI